MVVINPLRLLLAIYARLERAGYLASEKRVMEGRQRWYYTITLAGEAALAEARARLVESVAEVLETRA